MRQILLGTLLFCLSACTASADDAANPFARDILILSDWFEGAFDNEEQVWFENDPRSSISEDARSKRLHTIHTRVDLPEFGEHVFYVEEYIDNDPSNVIRQRLVTLSTDLEENAIRMKQGFIKQQADFVGTHRNPSKIELARTDVTFLDECDVYWNRVADQFHGGMKPKSCVFGEGDERRYSVHDMILSKDKYWRIDSTYLVSDDSYFKGNLSGLHSKMTRVKPFECEIHFYSGDGAREQEVKGLTLHSQGGMTSATRKRDGQSFDVLMRDKEYPYYDTRPDFIYFSIRKGGERRSIAFAVADPESRQIGMRTKEVGAFCYREGYTFRQPITDF